MAPGDPPVTRREYLGCGLWVLGFGVLVMVSFSVGLVLRPDRDPEPGRDAVTLIRQTGDDEGAYSLLGYRDETDEPCMSLRRPGGSDEVTGQCGWAVEGTGAEDQDTYVVTSSELGDGTTVVFAPVPRQAEKVRLDLTDGTTSVVDVRVSETAGFSWFVAVTDAEVAGPATLLDADGEPVSP